MSTEQLIAYLDKRHDRTDDRILALEKAVQDVKSFKIELIAQAKVVALISSIIVGTVTLIASVATVYAMVSAMPAPFPK